MIQNDEEKMYKTIENLPSWTYIDPLGLTVKDIEIFCKDLELNVEGKRNDPLVEQKMKIPIMATHFYYYIYHYKKIPTQKEFMKFYVQANEKWVKTYIHSKELKQALIGRLSRTYPSLLRDIHFYHVLKQVPYFEKVLYNLKYDLSGKVDLYVQYKGKAYGLQLRTKTKNSNFYYKQKPNRGSIPPKATLVDLPINLNEAREIQTKKQTIKLYGKKQLQDTLHKIHSMHQASL